MKTKRIATIVMVVAALALLLAASSTAAGPPVEGGKGSGEVTTFASLSAGLAGTVASKISYQGRLTDAAGNPLPGPVNLVFQLWNDATAGSQVGGDIVKNGVQVSYGLFTVELDVPQEAFNGQALWLRIQVNGQWLLPRQELLSVPYALSLRPGAEIMGDSDPVLTVAGGGLVGTAVKAHGAGLGVDALGETGVYAQGRGIGVDGRGLVGVRGEGDVGVQGVSGIFGGFGVEGRADTGTGVHGQGHTGVIGEGSGGPGVLGTNPGGVGVKGEGGIGVEGSSSSGDGVSGWSQGGSDSAAIRGAATGDGWGGYFTSVNGPGLFAEGYEGIHGQATSGSAPGVHGVGFIGVHGESLFGYTGYGVQGDGGLGGVKGTSTAGNGVEGRSESGSGVLGVSTSSEGVVGNSQSGVAVYGNTGSGLAAVLGEGPKGVYGKSSAAGGEGVLGEGLGSATEGVLGSSAYAHGVGGYSSGTAGGLAIGVYGQTNATWGLATNQKVYAGGGCVGCTVAFVGQNADAGPLEVGDVVSISGIAPPLKGQQTPVLKVRRATAAGGGALGVVQARAMVTATKTPVLGGDSDQTTTEMPGLAPGTVAPGDYLFVVVQGLVQVRADASSVAIKVGDPVGPPALPSPSGRGVGGEGGTAHKLDQVTPAAPLLGRALEPLAKGTGLIWVLVLGR